MVLEVVLFFYGWAARRVEGGASGNDKTSIPKRQVHQL